MRNENHESSTSSQGHHQLRNLLATVHFEGPQTIIPDASSIISFSFYFSASEFSGIVSIELEVDGNWLIKFQNSFTWLAEKSRKRHEL